MSQPSSTTIVTPMRNRFAFQVEFSIRFDRPLFAWDSTIHETQMYKHQYAFWWPRLVFTVAGVSFGAALWIGKGTAPSAVKEQCHAAE